MRLSEAEIIAGLVHPSIYVREVVAEHLVNCFRIQPDVTRRLVAGVEQFGWKGLLRFSFRVASFELDEELLSWLLAQLDRQDEGAPDAKLRWHLAGMIATAPVEVLEPRMEQLLQHQALSGGRHRLGDDRRTQADLLALRVELGRKTPEECWTLLQEHCREVADVDEFQDADIPYAEALVERIAAGGQPFADRVLEALDRPPEYPGGADEWLVGLMIQLAGRLRLEPAAELIYRWFAVDGEWYNEEISEALRRIGTPAVMRLVCEKYVGAAAYVRIYSWPVLESIHHDQSVPELLDLLPHEPNDDYRIQLGAALASHFDDRGIAKAEEIFEHFPDEPESLTIAERLFAHASLAGLDLPQLGLWEQRIGASWARIAARSEEIAGRLSRLYDREGDDGWDEDYDERGEGDDDDEDEAKLHHFYHANEPHYAPHQPLERDATRVGRNDPCPCGSGKKYKKCCLRETPAE